ncbi:hypothetical protein, partial [Bifidobacterium longum]|uniref:hypothetical protein n=1 Tax=Bifidobacterium longum TaxID=216816 RepID=UPI001E5E8A05
SRHTRSAHTAANNGTAMSAAMGCIAGARLMTMTQPDHEAAARPLFWFAHGAILSVSRASRGAAY